MSHEHLGNRPVCHLFFCHLFFLSPVFFLNVWEQVEILMVFIDPAFPFA